MPKIALVQMLVVPGQRVQNLARAIARIEEAAARGAKAVVLPEVLDAGWTDPSARSIASAIPGGETFQLFADSAAKANVYITAGLTERAGAQIFNSAVLISPTGELLLHHRKINELELAHDLYALGDRLQVCDTPIGKIGLMVCADAFADRQVISRSLGYLGADMIFSPCAWAVPRDHDNQKEPYGQLWLDNYCPVAKSFKLWIFGVSNVGPVTSGPWAGRKCIGNSLAIDPEGREVARGPYGESAEAIVYIDAEPVKRPARGTGWEHHLAINARH
ncbi:MAG: carbon-nitrogen hydrolase family protein [Verrucomicrobiales bacterium]